MVQKVEASSVSKSPEKYPVTKNNTDLKNPVSKGSIERGHKIVLSQDYN